MRINYPTLNTVCLSSPKGEAYDARIPFTHYTNNLVVSDTLGIIPENAEKIWGMEQAGFNPFGYIETMGTTSSLERVTPAGGSGTLRCGVGYPYLAYKLGTSVTDSIHDDLRIAGVYPNYKAIYGRLILGLGELASADAFICTIEYSSETTYWYGGLMFERGSGWHYINQNESWTQINGSPTSYSPIDCINVVFGFNTEGKYTQARIGGFNPNLQGVRCSQQPTPRPATLWVKVGFFHGTATASKLYLYHLQVYGSRT